MVASLSGLDPVMSAAVRTAVPADLRAFAAVTGLRSYFMTAPNGAVEVIQSQVSVPDNVLVFPVLVQLWLMLFAVTFNE